MMFSQIYEIQKDKGTNTRIMGVEGDLGELQKQADAGFNAEECSNPKAVKMPSCFVLKVE